MLIGELLGEAIAAHEGKHQGSIYKQSRPATSHHFASVDGFSNFTTRLARWNAPAH